MSPYFFCNLSLCWWFEQPSQLLILVSNEKEAFKISSSARKFFECDPEEANIRMTLYALQQNVNPVGKERKFNVYNTFRRHPRRFVNLLSTFNLSPVSTGNAVVC